MNTVNKLIRLRCLFERVPEERVDMAHWECGTAACLLGHACSWFEGLKLQDINEIGKAPVYKGFLGAYAGAKLFGITDNEAIGLFIATECDPFCRTATKKDALNRLDHLIERKRKCVNRITRSSNSRRKTMEEVVLV